jgi:hypothetical protein
VALGVAGPDLQPLLLLLSLAPPFTASFPPAAAAAAGALVLLLPLLLRTAGVGSSSPDAERCSSRSQLVTTAVSLGGEAKRPWTVTWGEHKTCIVGEGASEQTNKVVSK